MLISIVTVNYNNLEGLKRTVASVFGQTYVEKEMIVIDGGSADGSSEYIYSHFSSFAYAVSERDSGIYNAMNKGIKHASGEYVIFMNSGDVFFNTEVLSDVFSEMVPSADILYGSTLCHKNDGMGWFRPPHALSVMKTHKMSAICHQSAFIRTSLLKSVGYDESIRVLADYAFFYKCYQEGYVFQEVKKIISIYDVTGYSANPSQRYQAYLDTCRIHGEQSSLWKYRGIIFKGEVTDFFRSLIPRKIRKYFQKLPNSYQKERPITSFRQL